MWRTDAGVYGGQNICMAWVSEVSSIINGTVECKVKLGANWLVIFVSAVWRTHVEVFFVFQVWWDGSAFHCGDQWEHSREWTASGAQSRHHHQRNHAHLWDQKLHLQIHFCCPQCDNSLRQSYCKWILPQYRECFILHLPVKCTLGFFCGCWKTVSSIFLQTFLCTHNICMV